MVVAICWSVSQWRHAFRVLSFTFCLWTLSACMSSFPPELQAERTTDVSRVLENAFDEVTDNYVDPIEVEDLAVAGLSGLEDLEPKLGIVDRPQDIEVTFDSVKFHSFAKPPASDIEAWADATAEAIIAASQRSSGISAVSPTRVYEAYMEGIAKALGPGVYYLTVAEVRERLFPRFDSAILFAYTEVENGLEVLNLDPAGRLAAEGLQIGDVVTHVDHAAVHSMNTWEIGRAFMGSEGSRLTLTVQDRGSEAERQVHVTRWKIQLPSYLPVSQGGISGYALPYFTTRAGRELRSKMVREAHVARPGARPLSGVVLDLRGSVGGSEFAVEELGNVFLGKGTISIKRGHQEQSERRLSASWPDPSNNRPLIVLIDEATGAGAEVVTAALQDNGRALVIGSSTLGNGVSAKYVSLYNLGNFRMPVARNIAPAGYGLEGRGVMPDICISRSGTTVDGMMLKLLRGEGLIDLAVRQRHIEPQDQDAVAEQRATCPMEKDAAGLSYDLAAAIFNEPGLYQRLIRRSSIN